MHEFNLVVLNLCRFPEIALRLLSVMKLKFIVVADSTTELNDYWRYLKSNSADFQLTSAATHRLVESLFVQLN